MKGTQLFAVTGSPVLHSKSPLMFNRLFKLKGRDAVYFRIASGSASEAVTLFKKLNLKGLNVTAPHKREIIPLLDILDPAAKKIGAVNTVVDENGLLKGYNTDHTGVTASLSDHGFDTAGMKTIVAGAGGAGRAAAYGLVTSGADVTVTDISVEMAAKTASDFKCCYIPFSDLRKYVENSELVVHAVDSVHKAIDPEWIGRGHVIYDVNYKDSLFSGKAGKKGFTLITGLDMLLNQAVPAFRLFLGEEPVKEEMWSALTCRETKNKKNIITLTGFMGAGKTSAGVALSKYLGYEHIDTDFIIEKEAGCSIPEIFSNRGEPAFRKAETDVLERVAKTQNVVISCGGGAVLSERNREILEKTTTIWLYSSPETSVSRSKGENRPLLQTDNPLERAFGLMEERKAFYASSSDLMVNTEEKCTEEVAGIIAGEIGAI